MGWNDHIDIELYDQIMEAVDEGEIEEGTPAYGIAMLMVDVGYDGLSPKQRYVFDTYVEPVLYREEREKFADWEIEAMEELRSEQPKPDKGDAPPEPSS